MSRTFLIFFLYFMFYFCYQTLKYSVELDQIDHILKIYEKRIYAFFLKNIKIPAVAEDLTQDVLMKLWIRRKTLQDVHNMESFVFTIAKHHVIDHLRKARTNQNYKEALVKQIKVEQPRALDNIIYKEYTTMLEEVLDELPPRQKEVFQLSRLNGLTHDEIATRLNISNKTVRNHLFEALQYIRARINTDSITLMGILILCQ